MFELAQGYRERGMSAYVELQEREFAMEADGYTATKHQREVGAGYFDKVMQAVSKDSSTLALHGSTEEAAIRVETDVLSPEALAFVERLHRELNPGARAPARGAGRATGSSACGSCGRRRTSPSLRRPPTCRTAASRSPGRSSAR